MLFTVGWLGVVFLLVSTGAETDLGLIRRLGRAAAIVSVTSLVVPLGLGFLTGTWMPERLMADPTQRNIFALFMAAALSISSLPVMAKILSEMNLLRRDFGQLTLAAGMVNDVVGLGAARSRGRTGPGRRGGDRRSDVDDRRRGRVLRARVHGRAVRPRSPSSEGSARRGNDPVAGLSVLLVVVLALGVVTQWLGVEAVLGAFVAGILLGRSKFSEPEGAALARGGHQLRSSPRSSSPPPGCGSTSASSPIGRSRMWTVIVVARGQRREVRRLLHRRPDRPASTPVNRRRCRSGSMPAARWRSSSPPSGCHWACSTTSRTRPWS